MSKVVENIYGILDETGDCPFYISFYKEKKDALKELNTQLKSSMMEFGWEPHIVGDSVVLDNKVIYQIEKFKLK